MRRIVLVTALVGVVTAGVLFVQKLNRDRAYQALMTAGDQALDAANAYAAIEAYSGALALRPDSMAAYLHRGEAYHHQQLDDAAIRDLREASRLAPSATQPWEALGDIADVHDQPAEAAEYFAQSVALDSQNPTVLYKLALARYRSGMPAAAIESLRQALAIRASFPEGQYLLGLALRDTQDFDGAITALERAVRLAPTLDAAREELADLYRVKGRSVDEIAALQAVAAIDHRASRTVAIALAESRHGEYDDAIATLTSLQAQSPADPEIQLALGRVSLAQAERRLDRAALARATATLEHVLAVSGPRSDGLALLGHARAVAGDDEAAERLLREAIATAPVAIDAFGYLADVAERRGHYTDAREALVKLAALEGDTAPAVVVSARQRRLGVLSLQAGDPAGAVPYLQQAVNTGHRDAPTLGALADAAWRSGQKDLALASLTQAIAIDPHDPDVVRLRRQIR